MMYIVFICYFIVIVFDREILNKKMKNEGNFFSIYVIYNNRIGI